MHSAPAPRDLYLSAMVLSARQLIAGVAAGDTEALVARLMALEETAQRVEQLEARAELGIHRATVVEGV